MSYLGGRGVMCVGNGSHFCTPVLMNMWNITFQVLRLSTFVFNKCSEKKYSRLYLWLRAWRVLVGIMLAQRRRCWPSITFSIGPMYCVIWCFWHRMLMCHQHNAAVRKHGTITQCCFNAGPASKTVGQHWNIIGWMPRVCAKYTTDRVID